MTQENPAPGVATADPVNQVATHPPSALNNGQRRELIQTQIALRLRVLEAWCDQGVPDCHRVPVSLNAVRTWAVPSLGILPIGSPSTFTTTHRAHGGLVKRIGDVLRDLAAQRRPRPLAKKRAAARRQARLAAQDRMLVEAANQCAAKSVVLQETVRKLRITEQSLDAAQSENVELRSENRELRSELARRSSPATVTDLRARRPGSASGKGG